MVENLEADTSANHCNITCKRNQICGVYVMKIEIVEDVVVIDGVEYRRKSRTLTYTITMPEPLMEAPKVGEVYYVVALYAEGFYMEHEWSGCETDIRFLKRGMCFTTKEDAIAAAKAMMPIKGEEA